MTHLDAFADGLITAHRTGTGFLPDGRLPATRAEAYHVQRRVAAALGPVAGFKVGRHPGQAAIVAPIPGRYVVATGASVALGDRMGLELEVGWLIVAPLPSIPGGTDSAALRRCVRPVPVIELVACRLRGPAAEDPMSMLADLQINRGVVLGAPFDGWDGRDFGAVAGRMTAGDSDLLDGRADVPGGSALATLAAFLAAIGGHCGGPEPGQVVITGSLHPLAYVDSPCAVSGRIDELGSVALTLS